MPSNEQIMSKILLILKYEVLSILCKIAFDFFTLLLTGTITDSIATTSFKTLELSLVSITAESIGDIHATPFAD